jgi:hypothetical protein
MRRILLIAALIGVPAWAQMDFSGDWAPVQDEDNTGNPYIGEWLGIPMSAAGRLRVEAWDASYMTLPEWQCRPHGAMYISRGPSQVRIWKEVDPVSRQITAWHAEWLRSIDNPYYMDGRPRPTDLAAHTWGGFSTAEYEGEQLKITTTHPHPILDPPRRLSHLGHHRLRSGLSHRAHDPLLRVPPGPQPADPAVSLHGGRRDRSSQGRDPQLHAGRESVYEGIRPEIRLAF